MHTLCEQMNMILLAKNSLLSTLCPAQHLVPISCSRESLSLNDFRWIHLLCLKFSSKNVFIVDNFY